jgi:hypothetical protein
MSMESVLSGFSSDFSVYIINLNQILMFRVQNLSKPYYYWAYRAIADQNFGSMASEL